MADPTSTGPERTGQSWFMLRTLAGCVLLIWFIHQYRILEWRIPDRVELGHRPAELIATPVRLPAGSAGAAPVAGAWELRSKDPRFGGISGLAMDGDRLLAITDSGVLVRFVPPTAVRPHSLAAELIEVPDGPSSGKFKRHRDTEAVARDHAGRGWWVTFENYDSLWLFDGTFTRSLRQLDLPGVAAGWNRGVESIVSGPGGILLIPEAGRWVIRFDGGPARAEPITNPRGLISDAALLPTGQVLVIERALTWRGFRNQLAALLPTDGGFALGTPRPIPGGPLDNYEAIAVDSSAGGTRLWLMTDDNFDGRFRTLLVAVDLPSVKS